MNNKKKNMKKRLIKLLLYLLFPLNGEWRNNEE